MEKQKLQEHLQSSRTKLYCVLDGASVPDLPMRLYEMKPPNFCLLTGDLPPDMAYAAPYVIYLPPDNRFTEWILSQSFGKHWGIFVHCRHSMIEMRRHFRALVNVYDERANSMIFRFYDPRVLKRFLPTCSPDQLKTFFGKVETFFAEDGANLLGFQLENDDLKQRALN